jgi:hypothetical protein
MILILVNIFLVGMSLIGFRVIPFIGGLLQWLIMMSLDMSYLSDGHYLLYVLFVSFGSLFCISHGIKIRSKGLDSRQSS